MIFNIETERLILRDIREEDIAAFFALDSDPEVMKYIGMPPVTDINETKAIIGKVQQQYSDNGIGRWSIVLKSTNEVIGWAGLKLHKEEINKHKDFYDVGYRLHRSHWGKGYATEAAIASLHYGFKQLNAAALYGYALNEHLLSKKVLEKIGMKFINNFDNEGIYDAWYRITKAEYLSLYK